MRRLSRIGVAAWCGLIAVAIPARADWDSERKAVQEMLARTAPLEQTDPEKAALAYRTFYQQNQGMEPTHAVRILSRMIRLYDDPLKQTEVALQLCDWAIQRFGRNPARLVVVAEKARVLTGEKRPEEAAALIEKEWAALALARPEQNGPLLVQYCRAMDQMGKAAEATAVLRKLVTENAALLVDWYQEGDREGWVYERIIGELIATKQLDEALRWAKLRFVTCTPGNPLMASAVDALKRIWLARDPDDRNWRAFQEAQADPSRPNPLAEVKLPDVDVEAMRAQAAEIHWGLSVGRASALIAAGDLGGAMLLARDILVNHNAHSAMMMACTVLHAADLNTHRADACARALRTPQGIGPIIDEFLKQHPPAAGQ